MLITDLINRNLMPEPWTEGENIPWNNPDFSSRMLKEHLSQVHDHASRRFDIIDRHVAWIHVKVLDEKTSNILDLGCGPGLYTSRLARLGHTCTGIDYSPASVSYARQATQVAQSRCTYLEGDFRKVEYGQDYNLVMSIYGEFNTLKPEDAQSVVEKAYQALVPGGKLLLEVSTSEAVYDMGHEPSTWYTTPAGLFSDQPHVCLQESFFDPEKAVATRRYYIIDAATDQVERYAASYQGYTHAEFQNLLENVGFNHIEFFDALDTTDTSEECQFLGIVGQKPA